MYRTDMQRGKSCISTFSDGHTINGIIAKCLVIRTFVVVLFHEMYCSIHFSTQDLLFYMYVVIY